MRLFGKVDSQIGREDRPFFLGQVFTLAYRDNTPIPVDLVDALLRPTFNLPPRLSMYALDGVTGNVIADLTDAHGVTFGTDEHGFADLRGSYPMSLRDAFTFYSRNDPLRLVVTDGLNDVYDGRMEDVGIDSDGLSFGAFGFWRALSDIRVSALFSDSRISNWHELVDDEVAGAAPGHFEIDKFNRIYIAPREGERFSSTAGLCSFGYRVPDGSLTQIKRITFNYVLDAPSPWRVELARCDSDWNELEVVWSLTGNGSAQSDTGEIASVDPCDALRFTMFYNDSLTEYTGQSGEVYWRLTNPIIRAFDSDKVCADQIVTTLVDAVSTRNPTQLTADTSQVFCPMTDIVDARFEDALPAGIINFLSMVGDDSTPPVPWVASIWDDKRFSFAPKGTGARHWYVDVVVFEIERSLGDVFNTAYGVYREEGRADRRTAEASRNVGEVVRMDFVDSSSTSQALAETRRDVFLGDMSKPRPRAVVRTLGLFDSMGAQYPLYRARAGDYLTLRNLPPDLTELDGVQTFRIGRTRYDTEADILEPEPEEAIPNLAIMVARSGT